MLISTITCDTQGCRASEPVEATGWEGLNETLMWAKVEGWCVYVVRDISTNPEIWFCPTCMKNGTWKTHYLIDEYGDNLKDAKPNKKPVERG